MLIYDKKCLHWHFGTSFVLYHKLDFLQIKIWESEVVDLDAEC